MIFFDAYAIIEVINGNKNYQKYIDLTFVTNTLHLSELFYFLLRETDFEFANKIISDLDFEFIEITDEIAIGAAIFKYKNKSKEFSYADCIGYISAIKNNLKFLTGDKDFKNLANVEFVPKD